jgi:hypothetical protein
MLADHDAMARLIRVRSALRILTFVVAADNSLPPCFYVLSIGFKADVVDGVAAVNKLMVHCKGTAVSLL